MTERMEYSVCLTEDSMVGQPCDEICEEEFFDKCMKWHCKEDSDSGVTTCLDEIKSGKGLLGGICGRGCIPSDKMASAVCPASLKAGGPCSDACENMLLNMCLSTHCRTSPAAGVKICKFD